MMRTRYWLVLLAVLCVITPVQAQDDLSLPTFPGRIAYVGVDYNVYTLNGVDGSTTAMTDNAGRSTTGVYVYQWPTWATGGQLAYFGLDVLPSGAVAATDVYVAQDGAGERLYTNDEAAFTYAMWSPQDCSNGPECRSLAVLLSIPSGLALDVVEVHGDSADGQRAGSGVPFYFSWSPDGGRMLWQRNGASMEIFNAADQSTALLVQSPGMFGAPGWSPVDDRLLFGAAGDDSLTDLVIVTDGAVQTLEAGLPGPVAFAWSPDGNRVAYTAENGPVTVIDTVTSEVIARSPITGVVSFFWSPDSSRIAFITLAETPGSFSAFDVTAVRQAALVQQIPALAWWVLDVETGQPQRFTSFVPTNEMIYYLQYFDQFAQSHRLWSPDSRHLLYSEMTAQNESVLTLLDVTQPESVPLTIAEAVIGIWSFD